jgi:hypothetical protein
VDVTSEAEHRPGQPRSGRDAAFMERFNARMRLPIIVSAILPLVVVPESNGWVGIVVGIATWLVFLIDYLVHSRLLEHYGRTGLGRFDLFVVIATSWSPGSPSWGCSPGPWRASSGWTKTEPPGHRPTGQPIPRPRPATPRLRP